jgi:hypothetical protein
MLACRLYLIHISWFYQQHYNWNLNSSFQRHTIWKQIIAFIKKHIIILFTHKSIHNSDRKGIKYRMFYPRWSTSLVVNKQFWSDQSSKSWCWILYIITSLLILLRCSKSATQVMLTCLSRILVFCGWNHLPDTTVGASSIEEFRVNLQQQVSHANQCK